MGICLSRLHIRGLAGVSRAVSTQGTRVGGIHRVSGIQPQHVGVVVIPERHHKHHSSIDGLLDGTQATLLLEIGAVLCGCNPVIAEIICDGVVVVAIDVVSWVFDGLAILSVELLYLNKLAMVAAIICDELCGDLDWLCAVDLEIRTWAEEIVHAQPVSLHVTAILVAHTLEAVIAIVAAICTLTSRLSIHRARMHGVGRRHLVCLPDIDLGAASAVLASACVWISVAWLPSFHVRFAVDEFQVMWALGITVSQAHLSTCIAIFAFAAISIHLHKIQRTIQATIQLRVIHRVSEFLVLQLKQLISVIVLNEIGA